MDCLETNVHKKFTLGSETIKLASRENIIDALYTLQEDGWND